MKDDHFDELLAEVTPDYNRPPDTPREKIWTSLVAERAHRSSVKEPRPMSRVRPWEILARRPWIAAMAAALVVGIILGRSPGPDLPAGPPAVQEGGRMSRAERSAAVFRHAATPYLSRMETLLTLYGGREGGAEQDQPVHEWAATLLNNTRILLDSPAASDEQLRVLLEDLELVLAGIVRHGGAAPADNERWVRQRLERRSILTRLRNQIPAGNARRGA